MMKKKINDKIKVGSSTHKSAQIKHTRKGRERKGDNEIKKDEKRDTNFFFLLLLLGGGSLLLLDILANSVVKHRIHGHD